MNEEQSLGAVLLVFLSALVYPILIKGVDGRCQKGLGKTYILARHDPQPLPGILAIVARIELDTPMERFILKPSPNGLLKR